ncbi:DUF7344 domain-containing protein [Halorussus sp. AFM4]|uniref:DUF7344 domain-containing protein n=1 Tax=Halorussus sp. AFM4 TaxID=3421651 RepID=UPI003EBD2F05
MNLETSFDLLSRPMRRHIFAILNDKESLSRHQLTTRVAALEAEDDTGDEQLRRRIRIALHHNHLPKLADAGVITYDEGTVTATEALESVAAGLSLGDTDRSLASL